MFGSGKPKCSAWNVSVSPGEKELARKGYSPDEYIECNIVGLSLYTWLKCYSLGVLSDCMDVIVYYGCIYMTGLSATSQEMLSTAQGAE